MVFFEMGWGKKTREFSLAKTLCPLSERPPKKNSRQGKPFCQVLEQKTVRETAGEEGKKRQHPRCPWRNSNHGFTKTVEKVNGTLP
jgi:hypothetical protein